MPDLIVDVRDDGDECVVVLYGNLDASTRPLVAAAMEEAPPGGHCRTVVDAAGVTFIDVTGLRSLLGGPGSAPVVLRSTSRSLFRIVELTDTVWIVRDPAGLLRLPQRRARRFGPGPRPGQMRSRGPSQLIRQLPDRRRQSSP